MTQETPPPAPPNEPPVDPTIEPAMPASAPPASGAPDSPPADATVPVPSSAQGGPYRSLYDEVALMRPRYAASPVFGSGMWIFGVALWSFLVMGQLATVVGPSRHDFLVSDGFAELFVAVASIVAWATALRRTLIEHPARNAFMATMRGVAMVLLAAITWLIVTVLATAVGKASAKNLDGWITVMLLALSFAAAVGGRRLAGFRRPDAPRMGMTARVLWGGAALLTLLALLFLLVGD
jgi:hypothetical protein